MAHLGLGLRLVSGCRVRGSGFRVYGTDIPADHFTHTYALNVRSRLFAYIYLVPFQHGTPTLGPQSLSFKKSGYSYRGFSSPQPLKLATPLSSCDNFLP